VTFGVTVFDLNTRKVTNTFPSPFPTGYGGNISVSMAQDPSTLAMVDSVLFNVYIVDTVYGNVVATYNAGNYARVFQGLAGR
jgi:hypothetical protein